MIELSRGEQKGKLGEQGVWFSDLFVSAMVESFTGAILVKAPEDAAVFFREGNPVHAGGLAFKTNYLGDILTRAGSCNPSQVQEAIAKQDSMKGNKPLLGSILVSDAGVDPNAVKHAVCSQTEVRVFGLLALTEGTWVTAPGENARIRDIGVPTKAWPVLIKGLRKHAPDPELRSVSDKLLGKAIKFKGDLEGVDKAEFGAEVKQIFHYLKKPRKPDQLERALKNRRLVRAILRFLLIQKVLKILPAGQAIPIPKATLLKGQMAFTPPPEAEPQPMESTPEEAAPEKEEPKKPDPIIEEVRELHKTLKKTNHFEILDVEQDVDSTELRKKFTALAKKYHPDAFPTDAPEEIADMAREISARINEAYQTLNNDENRAEYLLLVQDDRIQGDIRKAEKIRDAEVKSKKGLIMLRKRDYKIAREFFHSAMENDPSNGEYKAHYAWAMYADPKMEDREQAMKEAYNLLLEALKSSENDPMTHFYIGQVLKAQDREKEALHHFKSTLRLDRKHADAKREVRLLEMRMKKENEGKEKKGGFSKLFKR